MRVNGSPVEGGNLIKMLIGSDVPGSTVVISLQRGGTCLPDVTLERATSESLAGARRLFGLFNEINDALGAQAPQVARLLKEAVDLWGKTVEADMRSSAELKSNSQALQRRAALAVRSLQEELELLDTSAGGAPNANSVKVLRTSSGTPLCSSGSGSNSTRAFNSLDDVEVGLAEDREQQDAVPAWEDNDAWDLASHGSGQQDGYHAPPAATDDAIAELTVRHTAVVADLEAQVLSLTQQLEQSERLNATLRSQLGQVQQPARVGVQGSGPGPAPLGSTRAAAPTAPSTPQAPQRTTPYGTRYPLVSPALLSNAKFHDTPKATPVPVRSVAPKGVPAIQHMASPRGPEPSIISPQVRQGAWPAGYAGVPATAFNGPAAGIALSQQPNIVIFPPPNHVRYV